MTQNPAPAPASAPPSAIVIFGANGDLTKRLVVPALYNLSRAGLLPRKLALIGVDHNDKSDADWRGALKGFLHQTLAKDGVDEAAWKPLADAMVYLKGDFEKAETYTALREKLVALDGERQLGGNVLFYLATADRFFATVGDNLGQAGLLKQQKCFRRLVVEKPFGHDLASAKALNADLRQQMDEEQIYRIDHFLGKETVQNILALRFANGLFEPAWSRHSIEHVQITAAESIGVETRGKFYEQTGALRDMVPNHLFQLVAMTAMEAPASFAPEDVRGARAALFAAMQPLTPDDAARGQYGAGDGQSAYAAEPDVAPNSTTETYAALKLTIDNPRWAGVPFYLRTGKRLAARRTEIAIRFKPVEHELFPGCPADDWLILSIQPDEGIRLRFNAKQPGPEMTLAGVAMDFAYKDWFKQSPAVGYETLLYDALTGDATLFQRADQVEAAWTVVEPVLRAWANGAKPCLYTAGGQGPADADALMARDGRAWRTIE